MPRYASNIQIPNLGQAIANLAQIANAPTYTTSQKNALVVNPGAIVFDTTLQKLCVYTATGWETVTSV